MKIIAKTRYGYLMEASKTEIDNIVGHHYVQGSYECQTEIAVSPKFQQLEDLRRLKEEVKEAQMILRKAADTLDEVPGLIHNVIPGEE